MTPPALLVLAPHPDDELLGAGGIMARTQAAGGAVAVAILTDGSASDPGTVPAVLAARREAECRAGLRALLGREPPLLFLRHRDGTLDAAAIDLSPRSALAVFAAAIRPAEIIVTDPADAHPDHRAAFGAAARLVSAGMADRLATMPVGQRVDGCFDPAGYDALAVGAWSGAKRAALACHVSQLAPVSGFSLAPATLDDFIAIEYRRTVYDRAENSGDAIPRDHFETMFAGSADPWGYDRTPYEIDRFARTAKALGGRRYAHAVELGCANGALTAQLAPLCDRLLATDVSDAALSVARERLRECGHVTFARAAMPQDMPDDPFDLIVASDMLYYLGFAGVVALMARINRHAAPACRVLLAHYLGETDTRLTGEMAAEIAIAHLPGWRRIHAERTDRLRIDVMARP